MGRFNRQTGEFTPKPSTVKAGERMQQAPTPLPVFRRGTPVEVFIGAGWGKGSVEQSDRNRCVVFLKIGQRRVVCYDARNVREYTPSSK
jgi:hypothetical protein